MDASLRVRRIGAAPAGYGKDSSPFRAAIPTELDSSQTVAAALEAPSATADDVPRNAPPLQSMSQDVLIDPQAREVMFRAMALRAGQALEEAPEEAMLKLKAYTRVERKKRQADRDTVEKTA
jgi:hypothetical protein